MIFQKFISTFGKETVMRERKSTCSTSDGCYACVWKAHLLLKGCGSRHFYSVALSARLSRDVVGNTNSSCRRQLERTDGERCSNIIIQTTTVCCFMTSALVIDLFISNKYVS
jgi:hypothetical protein